MKNISYSRLNLKWSIVYTFNDFIKIHLKKLNFEMSFFEMTFFETKMKILILVIQRSNYMKLDLYIIIVSDSINNSHYIRKATRVRIRSCMLPSISTMFCYRHNLQPYKSHLVTCCGGSMSHCPSCRALLYSLLKYYYQFIVSLLKTQLTMFIYGIICICRRSDGNYSVFMFKESGYIICHKTKVLLN